MITEIKNAGTDIKWRDLSYGGLGGNFGKRTVSIHCYKDSWFFVLQHVNENTQ